MDERNSMIRRQDWTVIERLGDIILNEVKGDIFEIGIGISTPILANLALKFDRVLYSLEKKQELCNWARIFGGIRFSGKSVNNMKKLTEKPMALGLIDGLHKATTTNREISFFLKRLSIGGIIFLHDTYRRISLLLNSRIKSDPKEINSKKWVGDIYTVRQKLEKMENIQVFTWPYTAMNSGLTMIMKLNPDRPYYEK